MSEDVRVTVERRLQCVRTICGCAGGHEPRSIFENVNVRTKVKRRPIMNCAIVQAAGAADPEIEVLFRLRALS